MARKVIHVVSDDIDGSENAETVNFSLDGKAYEIDLSERNQKRLEEALAPFIEAGRRAGSTGRSTGRSASSRGERRTDLDEIRAWAKKQGHPVADRGRIAQNILDAYDAR